MLKEFKEFIARGNVMDMAVGVILGAAFKSIIDSLVEDILTPLLNVFLKDVDFSEWVIQAGPIRFGIGNFLNAVISFLIMAWIVFLIVKSFNKMKEPEEVKEEVTTKTCPYCQSEISIEATRCPNCTSKLEGFEEASAQSK